MAALAAAGGTGHPAPPDPQTDGPSALHRLEIRDPASLWVRSGFAEMVPSIRLPTTHDHNDVIRVFLRVPADGRIRAVYLAEQGRHTLEFPPGTRSERVEYLRYRTEAGGTALTVVDVRGTLIEPDGRQRFHCLRPVNGAPDAPLLGWSWPGGDEGARAEATRRIMKLAARAATPVDGAPLSRRGLEALGRLNDCGRCHVPNHPRERSILKAPFPRRATDASGFYLPLSVLDEEVPLAATRPLDLNVHDLYVSVRCPSGAVRLVHDEEGWVWYRCPGDEVPTGRRDVRAGLAAGDAYTLEVCRARLYLYDHMDADARAAFAPAFRACAIP
jgi:hypothetical protein